MKRLRQILPNTILLAFSLAVIFWKFIALELVPVGSPLMSRILELIKEPVAVSWVEFYRGNALYEKAQDERETSLSGSILTMDQAITSYLASLGLRETREARANLETAQKEYRKLKEAEAMKRRTEEEQKKEEGKSENGDSPEKDTKSGSGSEDQDSSRDSDGKTSSGSTQKNGKPGNSKDTGSGSESKPEDTAQNLPGPRGYTNKGTFFQGFSGSLEGKGLSKEDEQKLRESLNSIKELQNQKGNYTRPRGIEPTDGMGGVFQKFFGDSQLFGNERDNDPYDY